MSRGCVGSATSGQRDSTYYPLTLLPNSVESSRIENRLSHGLAKFRRCIYYETIPRVSLFLSRVPFPIIRLNTVRSSRRKLPEHGADAPEGPHTGFTGRHTRPERNRPETMSSRPRERFTARVLFLPTDVLPSIKQL